MTREDWLNQMAQRMLPKFEELGKPVPPFRVTLGWTSLGKNESVRGECWSDTVSSDGKFEIFIAPHRDDSMLIAATLFHELAHAAAGFACGHRGEFARLVLAVGLAKPVRYTNLGPDFEAWVRPFIDELGDIPHKRILLGQDAVEAALKRVGLGGEDEGEDGDGEEERLSSNQRKKQSTRMLKAMCHEDDCGYTVRITRTWVENVGAPHCPLHGAMEMED